MTTQKQFQAKVNGLTKSLSNARDKCQELIELGFEHYEKEQDAVFLTVLVNGLVGVRTLPTKAITKYIQDHANVQWVVGKNKKGEKIKRYQKVTGDKVATVIRPDVPWYDYSANKDASEVSAFDETVAMKKMITLWKGRISEGKCKNVAQAQAMVAALESVMPKEVATSEQSTSAEIAAKLAAKAEADTDAKVKAA